MKEIFSIASELQGVFISRIIFKIQNLIKFACRHMVVYHLLFVAHNQQTHISQTKIFLEYLYSQLDGKRYINETNYMWRVTGRAMGYSTTKRRVLWISPDIAAEVDPPQAIWTIRSLDKVLMASGTLWFWRVGCPSCPCPPCPQERTSPSSVNSLAAVRFHIMLLCNSQHMSIL